MPALSPTMTEGKLARWLKKVGEEVRAGDVIAEIETDKATMEVEAVDEGKLAKILVDEGTEGVAVNTPIAVLAADGESAEDAGRRAAPKPEAAADAEGGGGGRGPHGESPTRGTQQRAPETQPAPAAEKDWGPTQPITVREALRDAMAAELRADDSVFLIGEEVAQYQGAYKVSQGLLDEFGPKRIIDTPITEHGFTGMAVGAALNGLKPIVEFMTFNFAMQAMDQIINSAAKTLYMSGGQMGCPIVFRGPNGAASRVAAQHSQCYASWYAHVPGLKVVAPWSSRGCQGPAARRDPRPEPGDRARERDPLRPDLRLPDGRGFRRCRSARPRSSAKAGTSPSSPSASWWASRMKAAEALAEQGIEAEVINLRSLRPFDTETVVNSVKKTNRVVSVEEGWPFAGIGAEVAMQVVENCFDWLDAPPVRVYGADVPLPYAANLEKLALPQPDWVVDAVKKIV